MEQYVSSPHGIQPDLERAASSTLTLTRNPRLPPAKSLSFRDLNEQTVLLSPGPTRSLLKPNNSTNTPAALNANNLQLNSQTNASTPSKSKPLVRAYSSSPRIQGQNSNSKSVRAGVAAGSPVPAIGNGGSGGLMRPQQSSQALYRSPSNLSSPLNKPRMLSMRTPSPILKRGERAFKNHNLPPSLTASPFSPKFHDRKPK